MELHNHVALICLYLREFSTLCGYVHFSLGVKANLEAPEALIDGRIMLGFLVFVPLSFAAEEETSPEALRTLGWGVPTLVHLA